MALTKNIKYPASDYHSWSAAEITNGDILGIQESLGNRAADTVTIESLGGPTTIRLNVSQKVYARQAPDNNWIPDAAFWAKPKMVDEVEITKDDIVIETDMIQTWSSREITILDLKVVSKAPNLKITIT